MKLNYSQLNTDFWQKGFCIIDDLFPADLLIQWKHMIEYLSEYSEATGVNHIQKEFKEANKEIGDAAGKYRFTSLDGRILFQDNLFPGLQEYYSSHANFLSLLLGLDVVTSEDKQSSISVMRYAPPGGELLYHYDQNFPSFVLYLTDNPNEGATRLYPITSLKSTVLGEPDKIIGESVAIYPKKGRVLIFNGAKCWHASEKVEKDTKISIVFNFFQNGINNRSNEVSNRLYQ